MKSALLHFLLVLLVASAGPACGADSGQADKEATGPGTIKPGGAPSGKSDHLGGAGIPEQITTRSAKFSAVIPAHSTVGVRLKAETHDKVVMWMRGDGEADWRAGLTMYRGEQSRALVYSTPPYGQDAHIPYQDDRLEEGWEFYQGGAYRLELANRSGEEVRFEFTLECLSGPCMDAIPDPDPDAGVSPDAGERDAGEAVDVGDGTDAGGPDADNPVTPNNPYAGLRNEALRSALQSTHYGHDDLGYSGARDFMFEYDMAYVGAVDEIECVYTGRKAFVSGRQDAQRRHNYNTEHTWPQSRGASGEARADMHHLFVTDMQANSRRASYYFGNVVNPTWSEGGSKLGDNAAGQTRFEPRDVHKGNVARAIFYFSVVYNHSINADEEAALRQWHVLDPVDEAERARNDAVAGVQNTRNFFIDWPELVDQIQDF